jgi:hypothetical protein
MTAAAEEERLDLDHVGDFLPLVPIASTYRSKSGYVLRSFSKPTSFFVRSFVRSFNSFFPFLHCFRLCPVPACRHSRILSVAFRPFLSVESFSQAADMMIADLSLVWRLSKM